MSDIQVNRGYQSQFPGVTIITAGDTEERIAHIRAATALSYPRLSMQPVSQETLQIACFGPSLRSTWEQLRKDGHLMTVSGAHDFLVYRGVTPNFHADSETRAHKAGMVTPISGVRYLLASCCNPAIFERMQGFDISIWHRGASSDEDQEVLKTDSESATFICCGSTIGLDAIGIGIVLGYRKFEIHGMDCSFRQNWLGRVTQHAGVHPNPGKILREVVVEEQKFITSPEMFSSAQEFMNVVHESGCQFILHGDGMLAKMTEHFKIPGISRAERKQ